MKHYRIKIVDGMRNLSYITRDTKGRVNYFNGDETPLSLTYLFHKDAAGMRFLLEDAEDGKVASDEVTKRLTEQWKGNPSLQPSVELLTGE